MEMMDQHKQAAAAATSPPLPVIPRLDRLDRLLQLLEEKHHLRDGGVNTKVGEQEDAGGCLPLCSALEQVHSKGTLMERLSMLEKRVLKLMTISHINNTTSSSYNSTTSSSTYNLIIPIVSDHHAQDSSSSALTSVQDEDKMIITSQAHRTQGEASTEEEVAQEKGQHLKTKKKPKKSSYPKKWFACLPTGC